MSLAFGDHCDLGRRLTGRILWDVVAALLVARGVPLGRMRSD